jgi:DEAD/DEAH box helicase domain-containing protein
MNYIVFDIETRNTFDEVESTDSTALDISVVCAYDSKTQEYTSYLVEDLPKLWPLLEHTDMLVTYNGDHFDIPLLNKYYHGDLSTIKNLDLLKEIRNSLGRRIKLDDIAEATLGKNKIAHGLEAIKWWREGNVEKIIKYCLEDVKITKEVFDYALANGHVKYKDQGEVKEIPLVTKTWLKKQKGAVTFSLPF